MLNEEKKKNLEFHLKQLLANLNKMSNAAFMSSIGKANNNQLRSAVKDMEYLKSNASSFGINESTIKMLENRIAIINNQLGGSDKSAGINEKSGEGFVNTVKKDSEAVIKKAEEVGSNTGYAFLIGLIGGWVIATMTGKSKVLYAIGGGVGLSAVSYMYYRSKKSDKKSGEINDSEKTPDIKIDNTENNTENNTVGNT